MVTALFVPPPTSAPLGPYGPTLPRSAIRAHTARSNQNDRDGSHRVRQSRTESRIEDSLTKLLSSGSQARLISYPSRACLSLLRCAKIKCSAHLCHAHQL